MGVGQHHGLETARRHRAQRRVLLRRRGLALEHTEVDKHARRSGFEQIARAGNFAHRAAGGNADSPPPEVSGPLTGAAIPRRKRRSRSRKASAIRAGRAAPRHCRRWPRAELIRAANWRKRPSLYILLLYSLADVSRPEGRKAHGPANLAFGSVKRIAGRLFHLFGGRSPAVGA